MMPSSVLLGRAAELQALEQHYDRAGGQLALVYGRRRIGKSFLLEHFSRGKPCVFYQATQQAEARELDAFTEVVRSAVGSTFLPSGYTFPTWESALDFLSEHQSEHRLLVILDEFTYLLQSTSGLASIVQRWWDNRGKRSAIMLVLCGSVQAVMQDLDAGSQPLHQRFTMKLHVGPVTYRDAAAFVPALSREDQARVFGILGGTPLNLLQWNPAQTIRDNLVALFADPSSVLVDSAELVLASEADGQAALRVAQAVALGATKSNEIKQQARVTTERALQRAIAIGAVERRTPITEHAERTKRSLYRIGDPYFRFYFRFIALNRGAIARGLGENLIDDRIMPALETFMGQAFEDIASAFVRERMKARALPGDDLGAWWSTDGKHEIDLVGVSGRLPVFAASVKWRVEKLGDGTLHDLQDDIRAMHAGHDLPKILIGRGGIHTVLAKRRDVTGYSIDDLYAQ